MFITWVRDSALCFVNLGVFRLKSLQPLWRCRVAAAAAASTVITSHFQYRQSLTSLALCWVLRTSAFKNQAERLHVTLRHSKALESNVDLQTWLILRKIIHNEVVTYTECSSKTSGKCSTGHIEQTSLCYFDTAVKLRPVKRSTAAVTSSGAAGRLRKQWGAFS